MEVLQIRQAHVDQMIAHAQSEYPNECCGILVGKGDLGTKLYRTTNAVKSPVRYQIAPEEQLAAELDAEKNG